MKRSFDIFVSTSLLIFLLPVFAIVSFLVWRRLGGPVLFRQVRPGKDAKPFEMIKFRTMTNARAADGTLLSDAERLTPFGRFLRSTSLDELPELWNVLKGDMSLVGPRPLAMAYLPLYSREQWRRHEVKPGITGLAQVKGRNSLTWSQKFSHDIWYVENRSFWLDLRILFMTLSVVVFKTGVSEGGQQDVKSFDGTN